MTPEVTRPARIPRRAAAVSATLALGLALLVLSACQGGSAPQLAPGATSTLIQMTLCPACAQTAQVSALTQAAIIIRAQQAQAAATAAIQQAHALASARAGTA